MRNGKTSEQSEILRLLPSIDALLHTETARRLLPQIGAKRLTTLARNATDDLRSEIQNRILQNQTDIIDFSREEFIKAAEEKLESVWQSERKTRFRRLINATGVIVHTNLGRAPLSENAKAAIVEEASRYCNLEFDIKTGKRGKRGANVENLLAKLAGAEDALIVNNCAAACVLILTALAQGGEAVISRGELVEIGGDFRIPDVMRESGAHLREVGTTNRTRISDYEKAINENTRLLLKVHPSNYRIVGFTSAPTLSELAELAHRNKVLLYEDAGSGAMFDLSEFGLSNEPIISNSIAAGADVVSFSGDKLFGAAQAGLIVGRREVIEDLRKHPLYRVLRAGKLIYAALEATLEDYRKETFLREIPVLRMISTTGAELETRILSFAEKLRQKIVGNSDMRFEVIEGNSIIGGGSAPTIQFASPLLALRHKIFPVSVLESKLRLSEPPVITRIFDEKVTIDLRTVSESEEAELLKILVKISRE